ncbi:hypothetical protein [Candidatus Nanohalobium constans]|uniref:hypothetical protein n=1 Tax=Candidatus Nanohalobium constans TaxID=2565781 RepID=UPI0012983A03|nr:hypothetical protein [Candidatus Nanohalobium constans]
MSEVDVESVASVTGESRGEVLRKGLESYISTQLRECRARVKELKSEYSVDSLSELEKQVESGEVDEHPAWEAVIEWRNLKERIETLEQF